MQFKDGKRKMHFCWRVKVKTTLIRYLSHLINNGLIRCTGQYKLILILKCKEISLRYARIILSLQLALRWHASILMHRVLHDHVPRPVHAPLAEALVTPHAVHRGLIGAKLHVEYIRVFMCSPAIQVFLLWHVWNKTTEMVMVCVYTVCGGLPKSRIMPSLAPVTSRVLLWLKAMQLMATGLGEMGKAHWELRKELEELYNFSILAGHLLFLCLQVVYVDSPRVDFMGILC